MRGKEEKAEKGSCCSGVRLIHSMNVDDDPPRRERESTGAKPLFSFYGTLIANDPLCVYTRAAASLREKRERDEKGEVL